jgi:acetyl-CoA C-acetyltransferase
VALDPRTPVLVGVGTSTVAAEPTELMALAAEAAGADSGVPGLLAHLGRIGVPQGTWSYPDPARLVAERLGASGARTLLAELGVSQQSVVSDALAAISEGSAEVALVVGGEARAWAKGGGTETPQAPADPDVTLRRGPDILDEAELAVRLVVPVEQYAIIENALAHAEGLDAAAQRAQVGQLWERFNQVARTNPAAAFPEARDAAWLTTPGPDNRPLATPYTSWLATHWTVDQAAALLLCSVEAARRHGVSTDRWVFPRVALNAGAEIPLSRRRHLHRWPAMGLLGRRAAEHLGRPLAEVEHLETYSCFPSAVRVQQRELGLDPDGTPTVTGGMAFAGGPFNNFTYQATAAVVDRLRSAPGTEGAVTTVSGLLTKPGLAVWATTPPEEPPLVADLGDEALAATETAVVHLGHHGSATVVGHTVATRAGQDPQLMVIAELEDGTRCVAVGHDPGSSARW